MKLITNALTTHGTYQLAEVLVVPLPGEWSVLLVFALLMYIARLEHQSIPRQYVYRSQDKQKLDSETSFVSLEASIWPPKIKMKYRRTKKYK